MVSLRGQSVDDDGEEDDEEDEEDEEDDDDEEEGYEQEENRRNKMNVPTNHLHNDNDSDLPLSTSSSATLDVSSLLVKDLRTHLKELGLPAYGSKKELIERLLSHSEANSLSQPPQQPQSQELQSQSQPLIEPQLSPPQLQPSPLWRKSVTPPATIEENDLWTVSTIVQLLKDSPKRTSSSRIIGKSHNNRIDYEDLFALVVVTISIYDLSCRCLFHTSNISFSYTSLVEVLMTFSSLSLQYTMTHRISTIYVSTLSLTCPCLSPPPPPPPPLFLSHRTSFAEFACCGL